MRKSLIILLLLTSFYARAGKKVRVLFIGNSYTHVNNMPQILVDVATASGDTVLWETESPGGFTLNQHSTNTATINKIKQGNWDYVVLQDQSQTPAMPNDFVATGFFPYVRQLDSMTDQYNPCAQTIMYMTWGRKNGDNSLCQQYTINFSWPHYCSYAAMDSVLHLRYMMAADSIKGSVSPASAVWRYIRKNYTGIDLYDPDESHPSAAGSYAVALSFYTAIFRKDPVLTSTYNYTLNATDAGNIRTAAKKVAYDSMQHWHIGQYELQAGFTHTNTGSSFTFTNKSVNATSYKWYFGDGDSSTQANTQHLYSGMGSKTVMLVATNSSTGCRDTFYSKIAVPESVEGNNKNETRVDVFPNPAKNILNISSPLFLSGSYAIRVYNTTGQMVLNTPTSKAQEQHIYLEGIADGLYFLSVSGDAGILYSAPFSKR